MQANTRKTRKKAHIKAEHSTLQGKENECATAINRDALDLIHTTETNSEGYTLCALNRYTAMFLGKHTQ